MENNEIRLKDCIDRMNFEHLIACVDALDKEMEEYTKKSERIEINSIDNLVYVDGKLKLKDALIFGTTNAISAEIANKKTLKNFLRELLDGFIHFENYPDIEKNISTSIRNIKCSGALLLVEFLTYMNNTYGQGEFDTLSSIRNELTERQLKLKK